MLKNFEIKYEIIKSYKNPFTGRFLTIFDLYKESKLAILNSVYDILIFNIQTTECIHKININESNKIYCLKWISKSKLAIGLFYNIQIWDLAENAKLKDLNHNVVSIDDLYYNELNNHLICSLLNGDVKIWDLNSYECIRKLNHSTNLKILINNKNGKMIGYNYFDKEIKVWNAFLNYECELVKKVNDDCFIDLTSDGNILCIFQRYIEVLDCLNGNRLKYIYLYEKIPNGLKMFKIISEFLCLIVSEENSQIDLQLFNLYLGEFVHKFDKIEAIKSIQSLCLLENGDFILMDDNENERFIKFYMLKI